MNIRYTQYLLVKIYRMCYIIVGDSMKRLLRVYRDMDKTILFTTLILIVFGTLNIVTASSREAALNTNSGMF